MVTRETPAFTEKMKHVALDCPIIVQSFSMDPIENKPSDIDKVNNRSRNLHIEQKSQKIKPIDTKLATKSTCSPKTASKNSF